MLAIPSMTPHLRLLSFAAALLGATVSLAQVPTWPKTTPAEAVAAGIGVQVIGADYGNSTFVLTAYFSSGPNTNPIQTPAAFTSPDGTTWTRRTIPGTNSIPYAPRFLNGKFFVPIQPGNAGNGVIASSADGITWTTASLGATVSAPIELAFGNGLYVGCIASPIPGATQVVTSSDGVTWTARSITANANGGHVAFFNGKFYVSVSNFSVANGSGLYSSADGIAWTKVAGAPANPGYVTATASALLVTFQGTSVGQSVSTDGTTFTTATPGLTLPYDVEIRAVNGAFTATVPANSSSFDFNLARASLDGRTWTTIGTTANQSSANELAFGGGRYLFVGEFDVFSGTTTITPGGTSTGGGGGTTTAPAITTQPSAQATSVGGSATFTAAASGTGNTFQWLFNGTAIAGATNAIYTIASVTAAQAGSYAVTVTNGGLSTTSTAATLTVTPTGGTGGTGGTGSAGAYLSNLSIRSTAGSGAQTLIVGVTIGGTGTVGTKNILIRGVGPTLGAFGVPGTLADPKLDIFSSLSPTAIATNDNWDATATPLAVQTGVGAFALTAGSKDAALIGANVPAGGYSVQITGVGGTTGVALAELYDLTPAATITATTPRLTNISARTQVGTGGNILITGFNISGTGTRRLLIRGIGPGLAAFGVPGTLVDPKLDVYSGQTVVASNDNWDATVTPLATQTAAGGFGLPANSKDAVLIVTLAPGTYSAQVTGVGSTTGVALVEIYELP